MKQFATRVERHLLQLAPAAAGVRFCDARTLTGSAEEPAFGAIVWGGGITCDVHVISFSHALIYIIVSLLTLPPTKGAGLRARGGSRRPDDTIT